MSNLVIVAIPAEDDYVWKISSEKKPHLTLCFLGDVEGKPVLKIFEFLMHAVSFTELGPFGLDVDFRGKLGPDDADVLFFRRDWSLKRIAEFRELILKDDSIKKAYESVPNQYALWTPHLTLGYPETPAKEDTRDYPGIHWVEFDKIALWYGDFEGPEIQLEHQFNYDLAEVSMSVQAGEEFISHYGVKGVKWGVRRARRHTEAAARLRTEATKIEGRRGVGKLKAVNAESHRKAASKHEAKAKKLIAKTHAKGDKQFEKEVHGTKGWVLVHNTAAEHFNARIGALNKKHNEDFSKEDFDHPANWSPKFKKYMADVHELSRQTLQQAIGEMSKNPSGTRQVKLNFDNKTGAWSLTTEELKHANTVTILVTPKFDENGMVIAIEYSIDTLSQGELLVVDFLSHYGVKGMRWGVRKGRTPPSPVAARAESIVKNPKNTKTKIKSAGGHNHPATEDAIKAALARQKLLKSGHAALSNKELQDLAQRMNLETQVSALIRKAPKTPTKALIDAALKDPEKTIKVAGQAAKTGKTLFDISQGKRSKK